MARIVRTYIHRARPRRAPEAALATAAEFIRVLREVEAAIDEASRVSMARRRAGSRKRAEPFEALRVIGLRRAVIDRPRSPPPVDLTDITRRWEESRKLQDARYGYAFPASYIKARQGIDRIEAALRRVAVLFGEGEAYDHASRALSAALRRVELISELRWGWRNPADDLVAVKAELSQSIASYGKIALTVLGKETSTVRTLVEASTGKLRPPRPTTS